MQNDLTIDGFKISTWESEVGDPPFCAVNMRFESIKDLFSHAVRTDS